MSKIIQGTIVAVTATAIAATASYYFCQSQAENNLLEEEISQQKSDFYQQITKLEFEIAKLKAQNRDAKDKILELDRLVKSLNEQRTTDEVVKRIAKDKILELNQEVKLLSELRAADRNLIRVLHSTDERQMNLIDNKDQLIQTLVDLSLQSQSV